MTTYVVDASVAAKWFLPQEREPLSEEAFHLHAQFAKGIVRFLVPDLFWPEVGNVLWKAARTGRMARGAAEEAVQVLRKLAIRTITSREVLEEAFAIAVAFDRSLYDSIYVAAALTHGALLVTADERLAGALAAHLPVKWLGAV
ncbi:MAG: type II toxin-antitoxin system VapC family toxin [Acidobacteria bacterium]|nr:type II toxin-antitoxin system VapC family toxin [Acidobacteriota bacterium]